MCVCKKEVESCKVSEKPLICLVDSHVMTSKPQSHGMEQNRDGSSSKKEIWICWTLAELNRLLGKVRGLEKVQFL